MQLQKIQLILATLVLGFLTASTAQADPLSFSNLVALQNNGQTQVALFSNPGTILIGPQVTFLVDITGLLPPGGTDTLQLTFSEAGRAPVVQTFGIPAFGTIPPPFSQLFTFISLNATLQGAEATLRIDLLNSSPDFVIPEGSQMGQSVDSFTYQFRVAEPVPEPASLLLLGMGVVGVAARLRIRKQKNRPASS